ncbi:hypothetical protein NR800_22725 [Corallococcus interemptor]|uniref:hypothetical protein n=1 Tax=Corallococcus interemptor TaxID=2316720 RepID=UPI0035D50E57
MADVERQLEGRAEVLAAARRPHLELEQALSGRRWRRALARRPELVPALVAEAQAVEEALERVQRRAAQEAWPDDMPVLKAARELSARRERLTRLARRRLDVLTVAPKDIPLEQALTRLDALVRQVVRWELKPGEVLVHEAFAQRFQRRDKARRLRSELPAHYGWRLAVSLCAAFAVVLLAPPELKKLAGFLFMAIAMAPAAWDLLRSGHTRLTSERLLWKPLLGETQEVRLGTIAEGGVRVERDWDVCVVGDRRWRARSLWEAPELALLIELHRQPPLRGAARAGVRLDTVAVFPARLGKRKGFCVLGPQGLSFIPEGRGAQSLRAVTGHPSTLRGFDSDLVLDALRWLPEAEFDTCVTRMVEATGGVAWARADARYVPGSPVWRRIRVEHRGLTLTGRVNWDQQDAAERLLRDWPQ